MEVTLQTDFSDAYAALEKIDDIFTQRKVVQSALRAGMVPMRDIAKSKAQKTSGALAESIKIRTFRRGKNLGRNIARAVIYSHSKDKKAVNKMLNYYGLQPSRVRRGARHAHLIEFGWKGRGARPFLRPAFDRGMLPLVITFREKLGQGVNRELRRIAK